MAYIILHYQYPELFTDTNQFLYVNEYSLYSLRSWMSNFVLTTLKVKNKYKCVICKLVHVNPYSDRCAVCATLPFKLAPPFQIGGQELDAIFEEYLNLWTGLCGNK